MVRTAQAAEVSSTTSIPGPCSGYPYRIFPANSPLFSPDLRSHRLVSPIRISVLGRTYGTFLHYERSYSINVFLFGGSGSPGSGLTCGQKHQIPGKFPRDSGEISPRFWGNFPGNFHGKMAERAYRFHAPDAMMMVRTATAVLDDVWTRCLTPCHGRKPAESGCHFGASMA